MNYHCLSRKISGLLGFLLLLLLLFHSVGMGANGPTPTICTDKALYFEGDNLEIGYSCWNLGEAMHVDVYIALFTWFGQTYTLGSNGQLTQSISPCLTNVNVPSPLELYWVPLPSYKLSPSPPYGKYALATVVTPNGSKNWACDLSTIWFQVAPAISSNYYVNPILGSDSNAGSSPSTAWKTIAHALSQVSGSALKPIQINLAAGIYSPNSNCDIFPLTLKSYVYLRGEGAAKTTLDAEKQAYHVILCSGREALFTVVEGCTIKGGQANGPSSADRSGGGIYCTSPSTNIFQNNVIKGNHAAEEGGGIFFSNCAPIIHHNTIEKNTAQNGAGICSVDSTWAGILANTIRQNAASVAGGGIHCQNSKPEIRNNVFLSNQAGKRGGAISCDGGSSPWLANNMIKENSVIGKEVYGGGLYCSEQCLPKIQNNAFWGNIAQGEKAHGGGICSELGGAPEILNNTISQNKANGTTEGLGGGIYCQYAGSPMKVENCTISENVATSHGGGIFARCGSPTMKNNAIFKNQASSANGGGICFYGTSTGSAINNTIAENSAPKGRGGGVWADSTTVPVIKDCVIYRNTASIHSQVESPVNPTYCCVQGWPGGGTGNISGNPPIFVTGRFGKYYLNSSSGCLDSGSTTAALAGLNNRTSVTAGTSDSGKVDMGFHYLLP